MSDLPTISVLMPVYNAERYVGAAVESILAQSFSDFEFIIVDDGSKDGSLAMLQKYADKDQRIRIVSRPNTGIVGALNDGLALCRADWVVRMDADDWSYPQRFERQLAFMKEHPDYLAAGTDHELMDSDGDCIGVRHFPHTAEQIINTMLSGECCVLHPTVIMQRAILTKLGGYRHEYQWVEDYDLFLRIMEQGLLINQPEPLIRYRMHANSVCLTRHSTQVQLTVQVCNEARIRWGKSPDITAAQLGSWEIADLYRSWAQLATAHGFTGTATKYSRRYMRHAGLNRQSLRLFWNCDQSIQPLKRGYLAIRQRCLKLPLLWKLFR